MKIRGVCKTQQHWSWPTEKNTPFIEQIWVIDISTHQKESHFRVILVTELVTQSVQNSKSAHKIHALPEQLSDPFIHNSASAPAE